MTDGTHILGIRHHGPGSARSVVSALEAIQPQVVLIEGPPDADELLALATDAGMQPPVALLIYRPDEPKRAVFYPFAEFSPEWQAIRWAVGHQVPVRFMDLPQRHRLAFEAKEDVVDEQEEDKEEEEDIGPTPAADRLREDPFAMIAEAAGYSDGERWWEEQFEKRHSGAGAFAAVLELMTALRAENPVPSDAMEGRREAWMRQTIRETLKEGHTRLAVVCGAWHAPVLATMPTAKSDADVLKGMPKVAVNATWLPWTHRRLTFASGYGAGIHSPGYYEHLWSLTQPEEISTRWMTRVARLLREEDLEGSTASIIEATRFADTTAALRGCAVPGLAEFNDAAQAVFCFGDAAAMTLIRERLIVGDRLGAVPESAPQVPLQRDFQKETKRLRMVPEALDKTLEFDLRKPNDLDRSRLLHRLRLLRVKWGNPAHSRGKGTFKEGWRLRWDPEHEVALIESAPWGNTIEQAATRFTIHRAQQCGVLEELTVIVEELLLAELPEAVREVMQRIENQAALTSDVAHLMDALPPLAAVMRYGNVRQTDASMVGHIVSGLTARICAGLPPACASLNDDAAGEMLNRINRTHGALTTLSDADLSAMWTGTIRQLADDDALHGLLAGRCTRLLFDDHVLDLEASAIRLSRSLSRANAPLQVAGWLEGFLSGSGLLLLHQPELWGMLDVWLSGLTPDHFTEVLPLLRRTFSTFSPPERRQMGELARSGQSAVSTRVSIDEDIDETRANRMLPTFALLLGANSQKIT
jgi:hypothetical protein